MLDTKTKAKAQKLKALFKITIDKLSNFVDN
jgi:hypothetical protein